MRSSLLMTPSSAGLPTLPTTTLELLCTQASLQANLRPIGYLRSLGTVITPAHLIFPSNGSIDTDGQLLSVEDKYVKIEDYQERMRSLLAEAMMAASFLPKKWSKKEREARAGDIVFYQTRQDKVSKQGRLQYARLLSVDSKSRTAQVILAKGSKALSAETRNLYLLHRPEASGDEEAAGGEDQGRGATSDPMTPPPATIT